jgi:hypothetical protein
VELSGWIVRRQAATARVLPSEFAIKRRYAITSSDRMPV